MRFCLAQRPPPRVDGNYNYHLQPTDGENLLLINRHILQCNTGFQTFAEQTIGRASVVIALVVSTACVGNLMAGMLLTSRSANKIRGYI